MENRVLRIVVSQEDDMFVAQCLEHDICVQAPDMATLQRRFEATLALEMQMGDLDALPPAPEEFHRRWDEGSEVRSDFENADVRMAA